MLFRREGRVEKPAYPPEVLREAVVNALIHRDYLLSSTDIELAIYSDRLEIISPGRLPNGITPERMRTGCRAARNQLLKDVMRDYVLVQPEMERGRFPLASNPPFRARSL
jgi:ATP-dependent DNA helicase RecG